MSGTMEAGSHIAVFVIENGGKYHVAVSHWDELDAAYHHWVERKVDRVLELTGTDGEAVMIAAGRICSFSRSTPESRQRSREIEDALKAEMGFTE